MAITPKAPEIRARLATIDQLRETLLPQYLDPVPSRRSLKEWFRRAKLSSLKANPAARRGGGAVWYSVAQVERLLRQRSGMAGFGEGGAR
jgi:hypothetical protein